MKIQRVEVLPRGRNPVGSYAVIKLHGISQLNGPAAFQLEPAAPGDRGATSWPTGDLKPVGVSGGNGIVELLVGPEVTQIAALKPGVAVRFRMPAAEADVTVIWPDLMAVASTPSTSAPTKPPSQAPTLPDTRLTSRLDAGAATAGEQVPVERGLSRLQRRGTAAAKSTDVVAEPRPSPIPLPVLPEPPPAAVPLNVPQQTAAAAWGSIVPIALGAVIVVAMLVMFLRTTTLEGSGVTLYSALMSRGGVDQHAGNSTHPNQVLSKILKVGALSPSGVDASSVSRRQALERASKLVAQAKTPEERAEAAFWLRRALSKNLSEPRLVWAVTQLGTAHAASDSDNPPNYDAARLLWQWAADAGDAQAACFLGRLFERGLGVASDGRQALTYYERARALGGCPGLEQAIARARSIP